MMLSGAIWFAIPPLKEVYGWVLFVTVTMQELLRFVLFLVFRFMARSGDGVDAFLRPGAKDEFLTALSVGVGYALMSVLVNFYSAVVDDFTDDTAIYIDKCSINFFVAAGSFAMAFSFLHILLGMLVWPSYSDDQGWNNILVGYIVHLAIAEATLANRRQNGCEWNLGLVWGLIVLVLFFTIVTTKKRMEKG